MKPLMLILYVIPAIVTSITVLPNGNSPKIKMLRGMMVDVEKESIGMTHKPLETTTKSVINRSSKLNYNSMLPLGERYRRLIPYMTFYQVNELPSTQRPDSRDIEVERAEIVEARNFDPRQPKRIIYHPHRNIPRYQSNRVAHFNLASANPIKVYYSKEVPVDQPTGNVNPINLSYGPLRNHDYDRNRFIQRQVVKAPSVPFAPTTTRKPFYNEPSISDPGDIQYFVTEQPVQRFKLVPYEQTSLNIPPPQQIENSYSQNPIPVPVEQVYIRPKPLRPQHEYDTVNIQQYRKLPTVVSESYYVKQHPVESSTQQPLFQPTPQPVIRPESVIRPEGGFIPIVGPVTSTETPAYSTVTPSVPPPEFENFRTVDATPAPEVVNVQQNYYQYAVGEPIYKPEVANKGTLSDLLDSLQLNKSIPKPITRDNVDSSIKTLLRVLNALKVMSAEDESLSPTVNSTPAPFVPVSSETVPEVTQKPIEVTSAAPIDVELHEEPYLAPVNTPSQHLDDLPLNHGGSRQQFPPPVHSDNEGGTPGQPGVDYPVLTNIPTTAFNCKTQRYKGFFADPETRCQVWHYCDLNGGQASFLCPNGTIFSQAALTCDWWFNVRCATTTQLYVLNESLYKYILPHSPKFPEDYSGPLVDKYLTLKFKEMEEQFRKNKNKQTSEKSNDEEKDDDDDVSPSKDSGDDEIKTADESENFDDSGKNELRSVSEGSVHVETSGTSGTVQRLDDP